MRRGRHHHAINPYVVFPPSMEEAVMAYRVINLTRGEIVAELDQRYLAIQMADRLAEDDDHQSIFGVVELVTIYETAKRDQKKGDT